MAARLAARPMGRSARPRSATRADDACAGTLAVGSCVACIVGQSAAKIPPELHQTSPTEAAPGRGAPPLALSAQPGGAFSPANAPARARDEALHVGRPRPTLLVGVQRHLC